MSAGFRSPAATWIGGASAPPAVHAGIRSPFGFWIGGASAPTSTPGGFRSLLAFWAGGASAGVSSPQQQPGGGKFGFLREPPRRRKAPGAFEHESIDALRRARRQTDDEIRPAEPLSAPEATQTSTGLRNAPTARTGEPQAAMQPAGLAELIAAHRSATETAEAHGEIDRKARSNRNRIAILLALLLADD